MCGKKSETVDAEAINKILGRYKKKAKLALKLCAHCSLCAESCFLFNTRGRKPEYMPSYKMIHSVGRLYRKKGQVDRAALGEIGEIVWEKCVLCTRCYCPLGIDIPEMIALGRRVCRSQNVFPQYTEVAAHNHLDNVRRMPDNRPAENSPAHFRPVKAA